MLTDKDSHDSEQKRPVMATETNVDESSKCRSSAVSLCDVCNTSRSKYTCPGCSVKTCSLVCVKDHKEKLNCNGERNKFAWVDKSQYSDRLLLNDYRFLENAERSLYSNKMVPRNRRMNHMYHHTMPYHTANQSKRSKILTSAAYKRGVRLRIMPNNLSKHKSNTSFYTIQSDLIEWHIDWQFVSSNCLLTDERVPETKNLLEVVQKYGNAVDYPHLRKTLEDYKKSFQDCKYLIKVEGLPANRKRFVELKPLSTIRDNLEGLCLVEHPTIFVLPPEYNGDDFRLLDKVEDFVHLQPAHVRHLTSRHPDFSQTKCLESQLLDPKSSLYKPDSSDSDDVVEIFNVEKPAVETVVID